MDGAKGYLTITRDRSISNALRGFTILIDDKTVDKIKPGEAKRYALPCGHHVIRIAIDFYKSRPLPLELQPGQSLTLICGDQAPKTLSESLSLRGMGQSIKAMTSPADYLYIKQTGDEGTSTLPVQQELLEQAEPGTRPPKTPARNQKTIFLSYRREDSRTITGRICDRLTSHFGREAVFRDVDSIPAGIDFRSKIREMIDKADLLIAVVGPRWLDARNQHGERRLDQTEDFVRLEIESAMARGMPVIPVLVENANMPSADELPDSMAQFAYHNALPILQEPYFHAGMDMLIEQIERPDGEPTGPKQQFCVGCGKALAAGQRFCTGCGHPAPRI